ASWPRRIAPDREGMRARAPSAEYAIAQVATTSSSLYGPESFVTMQGREAGNSGASLDPGVQKFVDELAKGGGPPIYELSATEARKMLSDAQASASVAKEPADIDDRTIEAGPTGTVDLRIVRPEGTRNIFLPVILYIHGGGWVLGDK